MIQTRTRPCGRAAQASLGDAERLEEPCPQAKRGAAKPRPQTKLRVAKPPGTLFSGATLHDFTSLKLSSNPEGRISELLPKTQGSQGPCHALPVPITLPL